jgi:hypothetical protein
LGKHERLEYAWATGLAQLPTNRLVAQVGSLLYRRLAVGSASVTPGVRRLPICATGQGRVMVLTHVKILEVFASHESATLNIQHRTFNIQPARGRFGN